MKSPALLTTVIVAALALSGCNNNNNEKTKNNHYETMVIEYSVQNTDSKYTAKIQGIQNVEIRPQVSGCITEIKIGEGCPVSKGQVMFVIDQTPYRAALETASASLKSAEAKLNTAKLNFESRQQLYKENVVSEFDMLSAQNQYKEAEATVAQAKAQETIAKNNLSYTEVKSPVNGISGMIPYKVGTLVNSSISEPLVTVSDDSFVYAYFSMSESSVLDFQMEHNANSLHEAIKYMPEVQLILSNGKPLGCNGKIDAISGTVQSNTGSVNLRAKFPNPKQLLRNGSTAQIIIPHNFDSCIVVPKTATLELQTKIFVYKVVDHEAILTPVEISKLSSPTEYFVTEGLKPGDVIIAKGAGLVKNGAKID